ncbi:MAG TPA: DsbA family protein [Acidimicrobiales bacterium]|nr:DsbA family protein [Acidimicrobiales bacterium]
MSRAFAVTWDYRCPFARNAHEHIVAGLEAGADWDVEFLPFSLNQMHVEEGEPAVWDDPDKASTLLAPEVALVVRDKYPDAFFDVHIGLFAARHDEARDVRERHVIADVLRLHGVDPDAVFTEVDAGGPLAEYRKTHEHYETDYRVFGVPTFVADDRAVFVRLMSRPNGDGELATTTIERVLDTFFGFPDLNEFKLTKIPR